MNRKQLSAVLVAIGALALLLVGLAGVPIVSAQEPTPETEDAPGCGLWGWARGPFGAGGGGQWAAFDTAAEVLGLSPEELFVEMHAGKSLKEIAEDQGVDLETVQEAVSATRDEALREAIAQAVDDGRMSQEQADWLLEGLDEGYVLGRRALGHGLRRSPRHGTRGGQHGPSPRGQDDSASGRVAPQSIPSATAVPDASSL